MQWTIIGLFFIAGLCWAEIQIPTVDVNKLDEVPEIKTRCEKKTPNSYEKLKEAINETITCLQGTVIPTKIEEELTEAKKTGSMDEVFAKYCNKVQNYKNCLMKTVNVSKECMEESEISGLDTAIKVVDEIIDFGCFNDGDRLAMFVAEGGVVCIKERSTSIANCVNSTLKINLDVKSGLSTKSFIDNLPTLGIDKKKCDDLAQIRQCIVSDLETNCKDTTPANIVDALFKFINKSTCKKLKQKRSTIGYNIWRVKKSIGKHAGNLIDLATVNEKLTESCKENGGLEAINNFWEALNAAKTCFGNKQVFVTPKDEFLNCLRSCTKEWIAKVEACLPEESKFYPTFVIEAIEALIEFAYDHFNVRKLSPTSEIVTCLQRIKNVGIKKNFELCTQFLRTEGKTDSSIMNKTEVCRKWLAADECLENFVKRTCTPDITVDRFLGNLTLALQKPCASELPDIAE